MKADFPGVVWETLAHHAIFCDIYIYIYIYIYNYIFTHMYSLSLHYKVLVFRSIHISFSNFIGILPIRIL